jgi:type II secretory pathway component GspD/PulD (secretin)
MRTPLNVPALGFACVLGLTSCESLLRTSRPPEVTDHSTPDIAGQEVRTDFQMVPLKFASAEETAKVLNDFFAKQAGSAHAGESSVHIVADPRTNSLLVQAPVEALPHVLDLVAKLDRKVP